MSDIKIRDIRSSTWFWTHKSVLKTFGPVIGAYGFAIYAALCSYSNSDTQACYPSISTLAKLLNISIQTVRRSLVILESQQLISIVKGVGKEVSIYTLLDPPVKPISIDKLSTTSQEGLPQDTTVVSEGMEGVVSEVTTNNNELKEEKELRKKNKSSGSKEPGRIVDPRRKDFFDDLKGHWDAMNNHSPEFVMDAADASNADLFLKKWQKINREEWRRCLKNRRHSRNVNPTESVNRWVCRLMEYYAAPQNEFNRITRVGEKNGRQNRADENAQSAVDSTRETLKRLGYDLDSFGEVSPSSGTADERRPPNPNDRTSEGLTIIGNPEGD